MASAWVEDLIYNSSNWLNSQLAERGFRPLSGSRAQGGVPMIPSDFAYHRPTSVKEAISLLDQFGDDGRALAGGHSLIPMMKLRLAAPEHLIDLAGVAELKGIHPDGGYIVIGAMTTQHDLIASELLSAKIPLLRETSLVIAVASALRRHARRQCCEWRSWQRYASGNDVSRRQLSRGRQDR